MAPQLYQEDAFSSINEINNRIRILEERHSRVRERMFLINQNMIDQYKRLNSEMLILNEDVKEIKNNLFIIRDSINKIAKDINQFARNDDLKVLEKYINMWNPLNFVTKEEVIDLIKRKNARK